MDTTTRAEPENYIDCLLKEEAQRYLSESTQYGKASILFNIINLKIHHNNNYDSEIYIDAKKFINHSLKGLDEKAYNYDIFPIHRLQEILENLPAKKKLKILEYAKTRMEKLGNNENIEEIEDEIKKTKIAIFKKERSKLAYCFHTALYWSSCKLKNFCIALFCIYIAQALSLLPAPFKPFETFRVNLIQISENPVTNFLLNTICNFTCLTCSPEIVPLSILGILVLGISKGVLYITIGNYVIKEIQKRLTL